MRERIPTRGAACLISGICLLSAAASAQTAPGGAPRLSWLFESRVRLESRLATGFDPDRDVRTALVRNRIGVAANALPWLSLSVLVQDARAPGYGPGAPNTLRDPADLHEAKVGILADRKRGFSFVAGRGMLNYGETRLIGSPEWANLSRTYDHARAGYGLRSGRIELLFVSPVKVRAPGFNRPVLGERIWGTYNSFTFAESKAVFEPYLLRHEQNRPGGFTGPGRLATNSFGARFARPLRDGWRMSLEGVLQNGRMGEASHRAAAWYSLIARRWSVRSRVLDVSGEYKFASGTGDPSGGAGVSTFDQISPANHDKFGHEDLFGWRNIHNARSVARYDLTSRVALNFMYDTFWLARVRDALYNGAGRPIARSASGTAGRFVGQEADAFVTVRRGHLLFGAGAARFFAGPFIRNATRGGSPVYLYLFSTFSL